MMTNYNDVTPEQLEAYLTATAVVLAPEEAYFTYDECLYFAWEHWFRRLPIRGMALAQIRRDILVAQQKDVAEGLTLNSTRYWRRREKWLKAVLARLYPGAKP